MKKQIRQSVFETNSSSTHAICIASTQSEKYDFPDIVEFTVGEFGWSFEILNTTTEKASYLYTAMLCTLNRKEYDSLVEKIMHWFDEDSIAWDFPYTTIKDDKYIVAGYYYYIDHVEKEIVSFITKNKKVFYEYLFGDSFIVTGNDNSDTFDDYMYADREYRLKKEFNKYNIYFKTN